MSVYTFHDEQRKIAIHNHRLPAPWINYLSNGRMHAFVSQAGGGFAWWQSPIHYRLTRYRMHHLPIDSPGFYVYLKQADGTTWSPTCRPCDAQPDRWEAAHQPGRTTFTAEKNGLEVGLTLFMAQDCDALVWDLTLKNRTSQAVELDVFSYVELSQLVWIKETFDGYYWRHMLKTWWDEKADAVMYLHHFQFHPKVDELPLVYFASSEPSQSFSGSRDSFLGPYRDERNPIGVERSHCGNAELSCGEPCAALENKVILAAGETKRLAFFLGVSPGALLKFPQALAKAKADLNLLRTPGEVDRQMEKLQTWWDDHLQAFECSIPDRDAMRQINTWSPVNSVHTARYSRSVNPNAPGTRGWGFRDSCQDMLAQAYRKPEWAAQTLLFLLSKQFEGGHTVHSIPFMENEEPDRNTHSDNHLWLPMLLYAILSETGDHSLLKAEVPFLSENGRDRTASATVWEHMKAAVRFTESHLGVHGLPLTLRGDWNDIIGKFSRRGLGESVFAGQQYVYVLRLLKEIAEAIGDGECIAWLTDCISRQEQAILAHAWDGEWWLRGFDDDGVPVGSAESHFGKLFLNPQSWSVLSGVGTVEQWRAAMDAVRTHLDTPMGVKKLMPGFDTWPEVSDPFTGYGPSCGENGAVFCHANTWVIIAESMMGRGERAWEYFRKLVPHLALMRAGLETYQAEPYAWVSNIVGPENKRFGWANVTQVTGTAAWMDVAATQYLLGVRAMMKGICIDPCIPPNWKSFTVKRKYRGCLLDIEVLNPNGVQRGVNTISVDGVAVDAGTMPIIPAERLSRKVSVKILVTMG